jgi:4'-phosphopantetheinyl transferase
LQGEITSWTEPPQSPSLASDEVHVWQMSLEQPSHVVERFRGTLEADEIDRASRFHFEKHRRHFIVGRGFMRDVIARYLQAQPRQLSFSYGTYGKPALATDHTLRFNLSHSGEIALLGVTLDRELGVDVEQVRENFATEEIARRFFSRAEVDDFNALARNEQVAAFFRCWTRKEAYIKAVGKGLSQSLDAFDVTLAPGAAAALLRAEGDDVTRWLMAELDVGPGYAAAIAVEAPVSTIRCYQQHRPPV